MNPDIEDEIREALEVEIAKDPSLRSRPSQLFKKIKDNFDYWAPQLNITIAEIAKIYRSMRLSQDIEAGVYSKVYPYESYTRSSYQRK